MKQRFAAEEKKKGVRRDVLLNGGIVILCLVLLIQTAVFVINALTYQKIYPVDEAALINMVSYGQYDMLLESVHRNEAYKTPVKGDMEQLYATAYYYEAAMLYHAHKSAGNAAQAQQKYDNMHKYEEQMGTYAFAKEEIWESLGMEPEIIK